MLIGIDLGTTHSLAAVWRDGGPVLIPNALGEVLTPSAVAFGDDGCVLVGRAARDRALVHPTQGVLAFKRHMGTARALTVGRQSFCPEALSSLVLGSLKTDAERFLGEPVSHAVISVPAYFSDAQRKATRTAGELAGLTVERLINEPTAAALAYGLQEQPPESLFMVLDLGGGTFDVSILERFDGVMEVRASTGDNFLGGEDFVEALTKHLRKVWHLPEGEIPPELRARLWAEGERAKRQFGSADSVDCQIEWRGTPYTHTVSSEEFERLVEPLLARFRRPVERALRDAGLRSASLDQVVLAGGATRMPIIRRLVARLFGRMPAMQINPEEVVARGAAVMTGLIARDEKLEEVVMTDVCPYTVGTEVSVTMEDRSERPGVFSPIIERNTVVPASREQTYFTAGDFQTIIRLPVYQGEARLVRDNIRLGEVEVPVPSRKRGEVSVRVRFTYDVSGLLEVDVHVPETNVRKNLVIEGNAGALDRQALADIRVRLSRLKVHPREHLANVSVLAKAERLHEQLLGSERQALAHSIGRMEAALQAQEPARIDTARGELEALMDSLHVDYF